MRNTLLVLIGVMTLPLNSAAQTTSPSGPPVVVTTGEGMVKRAPDRAWVTVTAESRAKTPQAALKQNATAMSSVLDKLKGAGIPAEAIQTAAYDLQPEYDYHEGRQTLRGYLARNALDVRVDALPRLGEIIDLAVVSGATMISGVRFDLQDRGDAEREALRLAVADAHRRATAAAAGANMKLGDVIRIEEHRVGVIPPPRPMIAMRAGMAQETTTPVAPGELDIRAQATITATIR